MNYILLLFLCQLPPQTLYISVNSEFESQLIQSELTRDWTQFNPSADLTKEQKGKFKTQGEKFNELRDSLNLKFEFVTPNEWTLRLKPLSYKFGKYDEWEEFDKRAFITDSYPLKTVEYLRKIRYSNYYEDLIKEENSNNTNLYYLEYDRWRKDVEKTLGYGVVFLSLKHIELQAFDIEKRMWMTVAYPDTAPDEIAKLHKDKKYVEFYYLHRGLDKITVYDFDKGTIEIDPSKIKEPPIFPRPKVYVPPSPPWKE